MASIEFKNAVIRLSFEAGQTDDGKMIRKSKTYRNIKAGVDAQSLADATMVLAGFSEWTYLGADKIETSGILEF